MHAATAFTIHTTRTQQHSGGEYPRARLMLREVKKTVEEAARRRLAKQKAAGNMQEFRRGWHDSGAATHHNDGLKVHALDAGRCNAVVVNQATRLTTYSTPTEGMTRKIARQTQAGAWWKSSTTRVMTQVATVASRKQGNLRSPRYLAQKF